MKRYPGGGGFRRQPQGAPFDDGTGLAWSRKKSADRMLPVRRSMAELASLKAAKAGLREGCRHRMDVWDRCARFLTTTPAVGAPSGMP
jgi:hypothetical protein